ncbi:hypothetical protein M011DRAFT_214574 [Sporormia fimetaria CBS 119925]|uniref:Uncharacterized protein n=1 Tax=Sporormia fimetaria CBS 119925 TaxID=1340428 RepID=A0A6A6V126_9PLEO|nr:hypothetical protein M011DRAFT_214574 [Sporormia fimetaria CBS 119925]
MRLQRLFPSLALAGLRQRRAVSEEHGSVESTVSPSSTKDPGHAVYPVETAVPTTYWVNRQDDLITIDMCPEDKGQVMILTVDATFIQTECSKVPTILGSLSDAPSSTPAIINFSSRGSELEIASTAAIPMGRAEVMTTETIDGYARIENRVSDVDIIFDVNMRLEALHRICDSYGPLFATSSGDAAAPEVTTAFTTVDDTTSMSFTSSLDASPASSILTLSKSTTTGLSASASELPSTTSVSSTATSSTTSNLSTNDGSSGVSANETSTVTTTKEPSTTESSTTPSSTTARSSTSSSTTDSSSLETSTTEPSTAEASTTEPSTSETSGTETSTAKDSATKTSTADSTTTRSSTTESSTTAAPTNDESKSSKSVSRTASSSTSLESSSTTNTDDRTSSQPSRSVSSSATTSSRTTAESISTETATSRSRTSTDRSTTSSETLDASSTTSTTASARSPTSTRQPSPSPTSTSSSFCNAATPLPHIGHSRKKPDRKRHQPTPASPRHIYKTRMTTITVYDSRARFERRDAEDSLSINFSPTPSLPPHPPSSNAAIPKRSNHLSSLLAFFSIQTPTSPPSSPHSTTTSSPSLTLTATASTSTPSSHAPPIVDEIHFPRSTYIWTFAGIAAAGSMLFVSLYQFFRFVRPPRMRGLRGWKGREEAVLVEFSLVEVCLDSDVLFG